MGKLSRITAVTVEFDEEGEVKRFPVKVKRLSRKDKKPYEDFVKEQEKKHHTMDGVFLSYNRKKEAIVALEEEIEDISLEIDAVPAEKRGSLARERRALRSELRVLRKEVEDSAKEVETYHEELESLKQASEKMFFELQLLPTEERESLSAYIEAHGWRYVDVLMELNRLVKEENGKK